MNCFVLVHINFFLVLQFMFQNSNKVLFEFLKLQSVLKYQLSFCTMAKPRIVFVLGAPGSGKGTQCEKIVQVGTNLYVYC